MSLCASEVWSESPKGWQTRNIAEDTLKYTTVGPDLAVGWHVCSAQYWKRQLAGAPLLLELPTDKARPAEPSGHGSHVPVVLPAEVIASLRALAAGCGVTMFVALTAAWQVGAWAPQR